MTALQSNDARRLKILISLLYYYPHPTGLTYHAQLVAEELARRGHQVTVLASRQSRDLPRQPEIHNGVRIVRLWAPIRLSRGMIMPTYPWHLTAIDAPARHCQHPHADAGDGTGQP